MTATNPGAVFVSSPWTGTHPVARPDEAVRMAINTRLLREDGSVLIVEPSYGWKLGVSQVVFRKPSYDTLPMWQRPCNPHELPVVYIFVHVRVLDTPASPWLHALRGYRATVLRRLPSSVMHYTATYVPALRRHVAPVTAGAPSSAGPSTADGGATSGGACAHDGRRRSSRQAGRRGRS